MAFAAICFPTNVSFPTTITAINEQQQLNHHHQQQQTLKTLTKTGKLDEALHLIHHHRHHHHHHHQQQQQQQPLSLSSYAAFLHSCITHKSISHGQKLYLHLLLHHPTTILHHPTILSKFITLFSSSSTHLDEAHRVFRHALEVSPSRSLDESVWAALAIGYSKNGYHKKALLLYSQMLAHYVEPGNFTFSMAVKACTEVKDLRIGKAIHAQIIKSTSDKEPDQVVYNALLRLYNELGSFDEVLKVFETMPNRNVASWNALVSGFVKKDKVFEAFEAFRRMVREGLGFSWVSLTTVLPVCGRVTSVYVGKEIHAQMVKSEKVPDVLLLNSLMDMYAKCGEMGYCRRVFNGMEERDLTSWNTVLNGYAINGCMKEAMELFEEMVECGIRPDGVTFIVLLSGCSHAGLINEGQVLFDQMRVEFRIEPTLEHYACLVDIYGRGGRIEEALQIVRLMPMEPSGSIWGSLLNSCRLHGNVYLAEEIAKQLFEVEPNNPGNYVMLSNIYATAGMWEGVDMVREMMEKRGIKKEAGCSWILMKNRAHTFVAGGAFEFRNSDKYKKQWDELSKAMESNGYKPDTRVVLHDIDEEVKAEWVCGHSERVATMFGLIHSASGLPIRVAKNLRVCTDCHSWMKTVSKVTGRKIILRDTNRFHHFHEGTCTCNDYW